jgi:hypothetical protein
MPHSTRGKVRAPAEPVHDAVTGRASPDGFLHRTDILDTLGIDKPESDCRF